MNFSMPPTFPQNTFQEFGKRASTFFPTLLSDEDLNDPLQKRQHFERAWLAVRYRYRACSEYMVCPKHFPFVSDPKSIILVATGKAFRAAFPHASITTHLAELSQDTEYRKIDAIRNILAHRFTGRRNVGKDIIMRAGVMVAHAGKEFWRVLGLDEELIFDEGLIQRHLDGITRLLIRLISASLECVESVSLSASP